MEPEKPSYLYEMEKEAAKHHVPIIRRPAQSFLKWLLVTIEPAQILEVGTAVAFSAIFMSEYLPEGGHITTIEKVPMRIEKARENLEQYRKNDVITLLEGDASDLLKELADAKPNGYDFIFMDAAKGQYPHFLPYVLTLLKPGGILLSDNVLKEGDIVESRYAITRRDRTIHSRMREYLYQLTHDDRLDTVILPIGDGMTLSTKKRSCP
ncbi:MAG: O-methyltransferase [Clostridiales bacterium]|nr:O-methyltransferase [Clostridiales bacterium]